MGLAASVGKDNDELIDNLVSNDSLKTERIERIMRLVDRGKFVPETERENAYKDSAWKTLTGDPGFLHMSAPCIYASVLENLDLGVGMSFLNIGSGTGYFSAMVGFILGEKGVSHGIEIYQNVTEFANDKIAKIQQSFEASAFDWCTPTYKTGNAFQIEAQMRYDRIYCGALVPDSHRSYFCSFLKLDGVLILPYGHVLQRIVRKSENEFHTRDISTVTFSQLIPVNPENPITTRPVKLPLFEPHSLRSICRTLIRRYIRAKVQQTHKVEMRVLCVESPKEEQTQSGTNGMELDWVTRRIQQHPNRGFFGRRRRLQTIHFFEEDNEDDDERVDAEDDLHILPNFHRNQMQLRHFLTLVARERLNRHHAARARQEADGGTNRNQQRGQIRVYIGNQNLSSAQPPQKDEDVNYGFRFVSENNLNINIDDNPHVANVLDIRTEHADEDEDDANEENNSEEGRQDEQMRNFAGKEQNTEANDNFGTSNDDQNELEVGSGEGGAKMRNECPSGFAADNKGGGRNVLHSSSSEASISQSVDANNSEMAKSSGEKNGARISMKRQRTPTRSRSFDNSPLQKRIFSRHSAEKPSTSNTSSLSDQTTHTKEELANSDTRHEDANKGNANDDQMASENYTTEDEDDSSAFSDGQKENSTCLSAERQADYLRIFHAEFMRLLDTLPLNAQMLNFLKFEVN